MRAGSVDEVKSKKQEGGTKKQQNQRGQGICEREVSQRVFEYYNVVFPCLEFSHKTLIYQGFSDWTNTSSSSFFSRR